MPALTMPAPAPAPAAQAGSWLGVEIRHLAALAAIAETRSFSGAADRLGYVQSAVSQQLARLEKLVGVRLVDRTRGHSRVEMTEAGRLLLGHAERMLSQLGAAHADLDRLASGADGKLRIGVLPCVARQMMPALLANLAAEWPGIEVEVVERVSDRPFFKAVEAAQLDAAFGALPLEPGGFEHRELLTEPCVLLVPSDSPLAAARSAAELGVAEINLVERPQWRLAELVDRRLQGAGIQPRHRFQADSDVAAQALVSAGLAAAVMPRLTVDEDDPGSAVVELGDLLPRRSLVLFWHREREPRAALETFTALAAASCAAWRPPRESAGADSASEAIDLVNADDPQDTSPLRRPSGGTEGRRVRARRAGIGGGGGTGDRPRRR